MWVGEDTLQPRVGRKDTQLLSLMAGLPSYGQQVMRLGHPDRFGWKVENGEGASSVPWGSGNWSFSGEFCRVIVKDEVMVCVLCPRSHGVPPAEIWHAPAHAFRHSIPTEFPLEFLEQFLITLWIRHLESHLSLGSRILIPGEKN